MCIRNPRSPLLNHPESPVHGSLSSVLCYPYRGGFFAHNIASRSNLSLNKDQITNS